MVYSWVGAEEAVILPLVPGLVFFARLLLKCVQQLGPGKKLNTWNYESLYKRIKRAGPTEGVTEKNNDNKCLDTTSYVSDTVHVILVTMLGRCFLSSSFTFEEMEAQRD